MKLQTVDYEEWFINQDVLDDFDENLSLEELIEDLVEDMHQIIYKKDPSYVIDIGWYNELDINGNFHVYVIKDDNWDNPELTLKTKKIKELDNLVKQSIEYVKKLTGS